jgi:TorA maturation chaperone TorD
VKINLDKKYNVQQHIGREKRKEALKKLKSAKHNVVQPFILQFCKSDFNADLCSALIAANISQNKLNNEHFRSFLSKYCNKTIPNESTYEKDTSILATLIR